MAKGSVTQIMAHGDGLSQIFIQPQGPGHGAGDPGDLQGVGQAGAVMIALRL